MKPIAAVIALMSAALPVSSQDAAKPASAPGLYQLKTKSSFSSPAGTRAPFIPIGWVRKDGPVVMVQRANFDESVFRVTSILLGNPALAVINGKSYEEGQFLRLPRGGPQFLIRVYRITDGQVWLQYENKLFAVPLKRTELGDRKTVDPLLSEERDVVPMPVPAPAPAPAATPAPAPPKLR